MPKVVVGTLEGGEPGSFASVSVPGGLQVTFTGGGGPQLAAPVPAAETSCGDGEPRDMEGPASAPLPPPPGRPPFAPPPRRV